MKLVITLLLLLPFGLLAQNPSKTEINGTDTVIIIESRCPFCSTKTYVTNPFGNTTKFYGLICSGCDEINYVQLHKSGWTLGYEEFYEDYGDAFLQPIPEHPRK